MTSRETKGTVIVTGANGGLGSAYVERLLQSKPSNQYGIFTVRGLTAQSSGTLEKLLSSSSYPHSTVPLDLTSLSAVREFADDINSRVTTGKIPQIRAVVLNAHGKLSTERYIIRKMQLRRLLLWIICQISFSYCCF
jgi:NAD(P)-dependent dehydrogenase (short-subunit alcohol dehydrogenase family)